MAVKRPLYIWKREGIPHHLEMEQRRNEQREMGRGQFRILVLNNGWGIYATQVDIAI